MKKVIIFGLIIISLVLFAGCQEEKVVCNKPYILVGTSCCLDQNDNNVCDKDEVKDNEAPKQTEVKEEVNEQDRCGNEVCDLGEDCKMCEADCGECYGISDIQAEINKIISWRVIFKEDKKENGIQFYKYAAKVSILLGKRETGANKIYGILEKPYIIVADIQDKDKYLIGGDDLQKFLEDNEDYYITSYLDMYEKAFEKDMSEGDFYDSIQEKLADKGYKVNKLDKSENVYYNYTLSQGTIGNKVIESRYFSLVDYNVTYTNDLPSGKQLNYVTKTQGLKLMQSVTIFCSPHLIITLYSGKYPSSRPFEKNNIESELINSVEPLLIDAQALISMCEKRYDFTYIRVR